MLAAFEKERGEILCAVYLSRGLVGQSKTATNSNKEQQQQLFSTF